AEALGVNKSSVVRRAAKEAWPYSEVRARGGKRRQYELADLPESMHAALLAHFPEQLGAAPQAGSEDGAQHPTFSYDPEQLWDAAARATNKARATGRKRAEACRMLDDLVRSGMDKRTALQAIGAQTGTSWRTIQGWYYGTNGGRGARWYDRADWEAALVPQYKGRTVSAEFSPAAV